MNGLGGQTKSPEGVVIGLLQLQLPAVVTRQDLVRHVMRLSGADKGVRQNGIACGRVS